MKWCLTVCLLAFFGLSPRAQPAGCTVPEETLRQLTDQKDWRGILSTAPDNCSAAPAYLHFYRGIALAGLERLIEAEEQLTIAVQKSPRQGRYRVELAGTLFLQKRWTEAREALLPARNMACEECDPTYLDDFLATLYFLEGNLEAALKYWNKIGKPVLRNIRVEPEDFLRPELLHSALAFSPGEPLELKGLQKTVMTLGESQIVGRHSIRLVPRVEGDYDAELVAVPKSGTISRRPLRSAVLIGRELPFETLHLSLMNPAGSGLSWQSMLRWDERDSRIASSLTGPLAGRLDQLYSIHLDARKEAWEVPPAARFNTSSFDSRRLTLGAGFSSRIDQRWRWNTGVDLSWRRADYQGAQPLPSREEIFEAGKVLEYAIGVERTLLIRPEQGLETVASLQARTGRFWSSDSHIFGQLEGEIRARWSLHPGEDGTTLGASLHAGTTEGTVPFDKLFHLGADRDHSVFFRAHPARTSGLRGTGPWGPRYWLGRVDVSRKLYERPFFSVSAGPFVDLGQVARIPDSSPDRGLLLVDAGIQTRIRLAYSLEVHFSLGLDTRRGDFLPFLRTAQ